MSAAPVCCKWTLHHVDGDDDDDCPNCYIMDPSKIIQTHGNYQIYTRKLLHYFEITADMMILSIVCDHNCIPVGQHEP